MRLSVSPWFGPAEGWPSRTTRSAAVPAGFGLLACGYVVAYRFDPNAGDPEVRKAIGREHSVWGEQLAAIRASDEKGTPKGQNVEPCAAADRTAMMLLRVVKSPRGPGG